MSCLTRELEIRLGFFDRIGRGRGAQYERAMDGLTEALASGELARAEQIGRDAVALGEELFGARAPRLGLPLYALASALLARGELDGAAALLRRALDDLDFDPEHPSEVSRGQLCEMLASIALRRKSDSDATETLLRRWIDARATEKPVDPLALANAHNQLGLFLGRRGKRVEALARFEEARGLRVSALGPEHRSVAEAMYNAATFRPEDKPASEVERELAEVVRMSGGDEKEARSLRASALHNLGAVLEEQGKTEEARKSYLDALTLREELAGKEDASLRPTLVRLAQLHHREGRILFALPLYERALTMANRELGEDHPMVRAIEAWKRELTEGAD